VKLLSLSRTEDCSCSGSALAGGGDANTAAIMMTTATLRKVFLNR
jgi:hypothetical protein